MSDCRLLLAEVARLYERYEAGRRKPFNVFSVLRSASDEVNLHSRFLHALLDFDWKSPGAERENLKDFLQHVVEERFEEEGTKVERERNDIDILITNDAKQAVVIENKIGAKDQHRQLQKYHETLQKMGYLDIHLLYLTLYGDEPSKDSVDDLDYEAISYKDDLLPWLERCQKRAYDEPALRESVAQYRQLVRKLTGTDLTGAYMSELKELLLQNNNLVLACDLKEAISEAHIELLQKLWNEIESELKKTLLDLPKKANKDSDLSPTEIIVSPDRIRNFVERRRGATQHGLYYPFGSRKAASLGVEVEDGKIFFGVLCYKETYSREYDRLKKALRDVSGDPPDKRWPWCKYANEDLDLRNPTQEIFKILSTEEKRRGYATGIARGLAEVWNTIKRADLAR